MNKEPNSSDMVERRVRPIYCPCREESPDPCPACGATVAGNDPVRGICQATHGYSPIDYGIRLILIDRNSGCVFDAV